MTLSPDGRYTGAVDYGSDTSTLLLIPIAGGEPRELLRASLPEQFDGYRMTWTPDSRAVILPKRRTTNSERKELWLVPVTDGRPRKLDIDVDSWVMGGGGFQLRPNSDQIAFVAEAGSGPEVWALENFLSVSSATDPDRHRCSGLIRSIVCRSLCRSLPYQRGILGRRASLETPKAWTSQSRIAHAPAAVCEEEQSALRLRQAMDYR